MKLESDTIRSCQYWCVYSHDLLNHKTKVLCRVVSKLKSIHVVGVETKVPPSSIESLSNEELWLNKRGREIYSKIITFLSFRKCLFGSEWSCGAELRLLGSPLIQNYLQLIWPNIFASWNWVFPFTWIISLDGAISRESGENKVMNISWWKVEKLESIQSQTDKVKLYLLIFSMVRKLFPSKWKPSEVLLIISLLRSRILIIRELISQSSLVGCGLCLSKNLLSWDVRSGEREICNFIGTELDHLDINALKIFFKSAYFENYRRLNGQFVLRDAKNKYQADEGVSLAQFLPHCFLS